MPMSEPSADRAAPLRGAPGVPDVDARVETVDIPRLVASLPRGEWTNLVLSAVDDAVVRLGVIQGEYHWHAHAAEDEFFLTLDGHLLLDVQGVNGSVDTHSLGPHQCRTVPAGVVHRTRSAVRTVVLMVERAGVTPSGD